MDLIGLSNFYVVRFVMLVNLAAIGVIYVVWKFIKWEAEESEEAKWYE